MIDFVSKQSLDHYSSHYFMQDRKQTFTCLITVNNENICLKATIEVPEWRQWHSPGVFIVEFEQVKAGWVDYFGITKIRKNTENTISKDANDLYKEPLEHLKCCTRLPPS